jgi:hypothetical protein
MRDWAHHGAGRKYGPNRLCLNRVARAIRPGIVIHPTSHVRGSAMTAGLSCIASVAVRSKPCDPVMSTTHILQQTRQHIIFIRSARSCRACATVSSVSRTLRMSLSRSLLSPLNEAAWSSSTSSSGNCPSLSRVRVDPGGKLAFRPDYILVVISKGDRLSAGGMMMTCELPQTHQSTRRLHAINGYSRPQQ